jgi:hypothetical protein
LWEKAADRRPRNGRGQDPIGAAPFPHRCPVLILREFQKPPPRPRQAIARAEPIAGLFNTRGIQGAYRGYTGGKAPAWEVLGK